MNAEIQNLIKVWTLSIASLYYCYFISSKIPKGTLRLLTILPIISLFLTLPLSLHSVHFGAPTTFFLVWLASFKLLLFSFNKGPLSKHSLTLPQFISLSLLPIKLKTNTQQKSPQLQTSPKILIKIILLILLVRVYRYRPFIHPHLILPLYCCHVYLGLDLMLALSATPAYILFGFSLEPQFNDPFLTTSLQDFWGHRWNLMVSSILRPTVYDPTRYVFKDMMGPMWAQALGIFNVFVVSGLMHELIYYYLTRVKPTWEVTWFFVLHGVCVACEVAVKRWMVDRGWKVRVGFGGVLALGFLVVSGNWLFFPQLLRNGVVDKAIGEYDILVDFVKDSASRFF